MQSSPVNPAEVRAAMGAAADLFAIDVLPVCESTNSELLVRAEAGAPSGCVVVAEVQTAGRGRRGRSWISDAVGGSLAFSILWRFLPGAPMPMGLSLAIGVGIARGLEALGAADVTLKWPNDVMVGGAKLAGVLVELVPGPGAVIGVGLNLRLPADARQRIEQPVTDLAECLKSLPAREVVLGAVLAGIGDALAAYTAGGFLAVRDAWLTLHNLQGKPVIARYESGQVQEGRCAGVDVDGALLLVDGSRVTRVVGGEVTLRGA